MLYQNKKIARLGAQMIVLERSFMVYASIWCAEDRGYLYLRTQNKRNIWYLLITFSWWLKLAPSSCLWPSRGIGSFYIFPRHKMNQTNGSAKLQTRTSVWKSGNSTFEKDILWVVLTYLNGLFIRPMLNSLRISLCLKKKKKTQHRRFSSVIPVTKTTSHSPCTLPFLEQAIPSLSSQVQSVSPFSLMLFDVMRITQGTWTWQLLLFVSRFSEPCSCLFLFLNNLIDKGFSFHYI